MHNQGSKQKMILALFILSITMITTISLSNSIKAADSTIQQQAITKGSNWLLTQQFENGSWGLNDRGFLDSSSVSGVFEKYEIYELQRNSSNLWMSQQDLNNNDIKARLMRYISNTLDKNIERNKLLEMQNSDGGWGISQNYQSDIFDTVLVLNALIEESEISSTVINDALDYILENQNIDGSWSVNKSDQMSVRITANVIILLNKLQINDELIQTDLTTVLNKGSNYLISKQNTDKTWGMTKNDIEDTLFAYEAILFTQGLAPVEGLDEMIIDLQSINGSWFEEVRLTSLAMSALKISNEVLSANISSLSISVKNNDEYIESDVYSAYENMRIDVTSDFDTNIASMHYYIKNSDNSLTILDNPYWNTANMVPGNYSVVVQIKENTTGMVLAAMEKPFVINEKFSIEDMTILNSPEFIKVNRGENVQINLSFKNHSNINKDINIETKIYEQGNIVSFAQNTYPVNISNYSRIINTIDFYPVATAVKEYRVECKVFDGANQIGLVEKFLQVLPASNDRVFDLQITQGGEINQIINIPVQAKVNKTDVIFAYDQGYRMFDKLSTAKSRGKAIMNELKQLNEDIQFGVVSYEDYPIYNNNSTSNPDYLLRKPITNNISEVSRAIDLVSSVFWCHTQPQDYTRMLYESYSDGNLATRTESKKIIINFGDNLPHDDDVNEGVPGKTGVRNTGIDPGRDKIIGTSDDLNLQTVVSELVSRDMTLFACQQYGNYLDYWSYWSGLTGGKAYNFLVTNTATDIVNDIKDIIKDKTISNLRLVPMSGEIGWINAEYTSSYNGEADKIVPLNLKLNIPQGTPAGTYTIGIQAIDETGFNYGNYTINIEVITNE